MDVEDKNRAKARGAAYAAEKRERAMLDKVYGEDRPKCWVCGGRMDKCTIVTRCPWCGTESGVGV